MAEGERSDEKVHTLPARSRQGEPIRYEPPMILELGSVRDKTLQISDECQPGDPPPCP